MYHNAKSMRRACRASVFALHPFALNPLFCVVLVALVTVQVHKLAPYYWDYIIVVIMINYNAILSLSYCIY